MGLGAIVILETERERRLYDVNAGTQECWLGQPLGCVDVMGRPMVERTIQNLLQAGVQKISVVTSADSLRNCAALANRFDEVEVEQADDCASATSEILKRYCQEGIENSFVLSGNLYAETDLRDFVFFHREARKGMTRAFSHDGPLEMWVVDCAEHAEFDLEGDAASYFVAGYVRRLQQASDLRAIIEDSLGGVCAMRPGGEEVRPGIWVDEGADIDRRARIVAPAYIGCRTKVREDALVTRCSSIERDCYVDYGTIVEDSSILANTRVGIWLDVRHAVASGNKLMSLKHGVLLEISDSNVLRSNSPVPGEAADEFHSNRAPAVQKVLSGLKPEATPAPEAWQLGANLIQG